MIDALKFDVCKEHYYEIVKHRLILHIKLKDAPIPTYCGIKNCLNQDIVMNIVLKINDKQKKQFEDKRHIKFGILDSYYIQRFISEINQVVEQ